MSDQISQLPLVGLVAFLGLIIGSFVSLASYRLPRGKEIAIKRSHCTSCFTSLTISELIPLFSWLLQAGKCKHCFSKINIRYPLIELTMALIGVAVYSRFGISIESLLIFFVGICLLIITITDFENYIIPDNVQALLLFLAITRSIWLKLDFSTLFAAALLAFSSSIIIKKSFIAVFKKDGLGFGDIKLMAIAGLFLGLNMLPVFFFLSGIFGIFTAIIWTSLGKGKVFPFGPALSLSLFVCLLYPRLDEYFLAYMSNIASMYIR